MSTYILAFIVCDFDYISAKDAKGRMFRVWARSEIIPYVDYALHTSVAILNYFEDYFNFTYPLSKLDSIAVPGLQTAALENFGCIVYAEENLAFDTEDQFINNLQFATEVISHEIAHQVKTLLILFLLDDILNKFNKFKRCSFLS